MYFLAKTGIGPEIEFYEQTGINLTPHLQPTEMLLFLFLLMYF